MKLFVFFSVLGFAIFSNLMKAQAPLDPISAPVTDSIDALNTVPEAPLQTRTLQSEWRDYTTVTFGPRALLKPSLSAIRRMIDPPKGYPRNWKVGPDAFARNYGNALASRTSLETGRFLGAAILHEDFRYRPSICKNPLVRGLHALAFTFVDKSDSGHPRIAFANFIGAGASGFVGSLYLPAGYSNFSHAGTRTASAFAGLAVQNLLFEFGPELRQLKHKFHTPSSFSTTPVPKWWTKRD